MGENISLVRSGADVLGSVPRHWEDAWEALSVSKMRGVWNYLDVLGRILRGRMRPGKAPPIDAIKSWSPQAPLSVETSEKCGGA